MTSNDHAAQDAELRIFADSLDEIEALRIATENRLRSLEDAGIAQTDEMVMLLFQIKILEDGGEIVVDGERCKVPGAIRQLERAVKRHRYGKWIKAQVGIGEKQGGRMLAAIGDPFVIPERVDRDSGEVIEEERPRRGPAELWQYAGHGDPARSHRVKGQRVQYNPEAKMRVHLVAESCIKQMAGTYRPAYDAARAKYAEAVHAEPCRRCGPAGHPAPSGSPLSEGHKHGRALRAVGKAILKDLWREGREMAEGREMLAA